MYTRYVQGKKIVLMFDLELGREIATAFSFFYAGLKATPFRGEVAGKMNAIVEAMKSELMMKIAREAEAKNFALCMKCATEIDLRISNWFRVDENGGGYRHNNCPELKSDEIRNF